MATPKTPEGGKATTFEPGLVERIAGAIRYVRTGETPPWFGPNEPLPPQAPESVKGRPTDFPVGINLNYKPKTEGTESGLTFDVLRRAADPAAGGLDLFRIAIETRKDQMEAQPWLIRGKDGKDGGEKAKALMIALRRPDLVHTFRQWQRQLMEDLLVIDAPTLYLRPMAEGFKIPEVVDGATIKILVDENGRRPLPPNAAFQQVLKGLPANDYTLDELIYAPRNLRSHRFYGMSPVEQVINIINLGLKRQLHLISYYTAGNVPEQLVATPEGWNPDQIKAAQGWLDSVLEGNMEARRKLILVPGGMEPKELKSGALTDPLDEWIARVICWCFSLPPSALVKEVNRATAETAQEQGQQEGLEPLKAWWADLMNEVILRCWGVDDLEFAWQDEEISDPKTKMEFWTGFVREKIVHPDEARRLALKLDPLTDEQKEDLKPPPPPMLGGPGEDELEDPGAGKPGKKPGASQGEEGGDSASRPLPPASKIEKKKTKLTPINRDRPATRRAVRRINAAAKAYFTATRKAVLSALKAEKVAKSDLTREQLEEILAALPEGDRQAFLDLMQDELGRMAADGAEQAVTQMLETSSGITDEALDAMLSQANSRAIAWAEDRAADLVTQVDETTREGLRDLVGQALEEGWSNDELASQIEDGDLFSESRAEMIARTETAFADIQGNLAGWRETGVVEGKQWLVAQDEVCDDCTAMDGQVVALDAEFPGGDPPLHPNCRCDLLPVITSPDED